MGQIQALLIAEWEVVKSAPFAFVAALVVIGFGIWKVVQWQHSNRHDDSRSRLELAETKVRDYEAKLAGASPDEARARIDQLEHRIDALKPRTVSADQRQRITAIVAPGGARIISIAVDGATPDGNNFARGLGAAFTSAGWLVQNAMVMGLGNPPASGVGLQVIDPAAFTPDEGVVVQALREAGIEFDLMPGAPERPMPGHPSPVARITITNRLLD